MSNNRFYLDDAYRKTSFQVITNTGSFNIKIGKRCEELDALMTSENQVTACFITAYNPASEAKTLKQNEEAQCALKKDLVDRKCIILSGNGIPADSSWQAEPSFLALGLTLAEGLSLGKKYGQNAIVFCHKDHAAELTWCD